MNVTPGGHHSVHQSEGWICPPGCLAYIPSVTSRAARQSQLGSITITQQLCVFVEDYIFKRTLEGGEESSVTNYEGAHSRVQKAEALTLGDPAVWENHPHTMRHNMAEYVVVIYSVFPRSFSISFSPCLTIFIPFMPKRWERSMLPS